MIEDVVVFYTQQLINSTSVSCLQKSGVLFDPALADIMLTISGTSSVFIIISP